MAGPGSFVDSVGLSASELNALEDLTSWTPSWTAGLTAGNGTTVAKYCYVQNRLTGRVSFTFGSTSSISSAPRFTLPSTFTIDTHIPSEPVGHAMFIDTGTNVYNGYVRTATTGSLEGVLFNSSSTYVQPTSPTSTIPHTWATGDFIIMEFTVLGAF